jgi:tol-pal system protein YbgF
MNRLIFNVYVKVIFYVCIASICLLPSVKANSIEEIISKINAIENRIKVLEKATFNKTNSSQGNFDSTNYESIITRQSIQISELQNQIQELTGDIEEVLFSLQSLINNFNNFKADTEMRFSDVSIKTTSEKNETLLSTEQEQVNYDLAPKNLGTLTMPIESENSSIDENSFSDEQEITSTVDQESLILVEDNKVELLMLPEGAEVSINLLTSGDYEGAEKALKEFIKISKEKDLKSNAYFWLAETYYVRENYKDAAKNYLSLYQNHSESPKASSGLLKLGISLIKMGQIEQGCASLAQLRISFSETDQSILDRGDIEIQRNGCKIN